MPNWCSNFLSIIGPAKSIEALLKAGAGKDTALSFDKLHPTPTELVHTQSTGNLNTMLQSLVVEPQNPDHEDWYSWRVRNWGTKWDINAQITHDEKFGRGQRSISMVFESAWAPPVKGIQKLSELFPDLEFDLEFEEPGMGFKGGAKAKAGNLTDDWQEEFTEEDDADDEIDDND